MVLGIARGLLFVIGRMQIQSALQPPHNALQRRHTQTIHRIHTQQT